MSNAYAWEGATYLLLVETRVSGKTNERFGLADRLAFAQKLRNARFELLFATRFAGLGSLENNGCILEKLLLPLLYRARL